MIKRWILWPLFILLLLAMLISATFSVLVFTETGSRWAIQKAAPFIPGELTIDQVDGTFWQGLKLSQVRYYNEQMALYLQHGTVRFDWIQLWRSHLNLSQLKLDNLSLALLPYDAPEKPETEAFHPDNLPSLWLPFTTRVGNAELNQFSLTTATGQQVSVEQIHLAASTSLRNLRLRQLRVKTTDQVLTLTGNLGLQQPFTLDARLNWQSQLPENLQALLNTQVSAQGSLLITGPLAQPALIHQLTAPTTMRTQATLEPFATPFRFQAQHTWQPFTLFLEHEDLPELPIDAGIITLQGDLDDYDLVVSSSARPKWQETLLPHLGVSLQASGNTQAVDIQPLRLGLGNNQSVINLSGKLAWQPHLSWDLSLAAERLNPQLIIPELEGELTAQAHTQGELTELGPNVAVTLTTLQGQWLKQPFEGSGQASVNVNQTAQANFALNVGNNHIALGGRSNKALDWRLVLNINNFAELWPNSHGKAHGQLRLTGTTLSPALNGEINAQALGIDALNLNQLALLLHTEGTAQNPRVNLQLHGTELTYNDSPLLNAFTVGAKGTLEAHQAEWTLSLADHHHFGTLKGALKPTHEWQGEVSRFAFQGPLSGNWDLERSTPITASAKQVKLGDFCLRHNTGKACAQADWQPQGPAFATLDITAMPLAIVNALMPDKAARLHGEINLQSQYQQNAHGAAQANAELTISAGHVELDSGVAEEPYIIEWRSLSADAQLKNEHFSSKLHFDIADSTGIQGEFSGSLTGPINGRYWMQMEELAWLEIISPEVRELKGRVAADLVVGGTLKTPTLKGEISATSVGVTIPQLGLELQEGELLATARIGEPISITGSMRSGDGQLTLAGSIPTTGQFPRPITGKISGHDVLVAHTPEAYVTVNPDIDIELIGTDLTLRGKVTVPTAHLTPKQLPVQAARVSSDEYIISEEEVVRSLLKHDMKLTLTLGENVSIDGFGLRARFLGEIQIEERSNYSTRLNGSISIEEGRFRAYGQDLRVERGNVIFQGPPNNPGLDIVAYRLVPAYNVKAGLMLGGTLLDPRSRVFSEPSMDETEAMAFLLTGKPLEGGDDTDAAAIIQAIAIYGIEKGEFITNRVSETLGIDVGMDTEGEFEETALVLGKQLSSRLYLRYSIGLFEALNTVMLRYTVSRYVNLETRSNVEEQSIDLIYRRER